MFLFLSDSECSYLELRTYKVIGCLNEIFLGFVLRVLAIFVKRSAAYLLRRLLKKGVVLTSPSCI